MCLKRKQLKAKMAGRTTGGKFILEYFCDIVCKKFLESNLNSNDFESIDAYFRMIECLIMLQTADGKKRATWVSDEPGRRKSKRLAKKAGMSLKLTEDEELEVDKLQPLMILAMFCYKVLAKDLEEIGTCGILKNFSDCIKYFFDVFLFDGDMEDFTKRKEFAIKYTNSQRIIIMMKTMKQKEASDLFDQLDKEKMLLFPEEVKQVIMEPTLELPNFLEYDSFFHTMKQLVSNVFEKLEEPTLMRAAKKLKNAEMQQVKQNGGPKCGDEVKEVPTEPNQESSKDVEEEIGDEASLHVLSKTNDIFSADDEDETVRTGSKEDEIGTIKEERKHALRKRRRFMLKEENWLRDGIKKHGTRNWKVILESYPFKNQTSLSLKDKYRSMQKAKLRGKKTVSSSGSSGEDEAATARQETRGEKVEVDGVRVRLGRAKELNDSLSEDENANITEQPKEFEEPLLVTKQMLGDEISVMSQQMTRVRSKPEVNDASMVKQCSMNDQRELQSSGSEVIEFRGRLGETLITNSRHQAIENNVIEDSQGEMSSEMLLIEPELSENKTASQSGRDDADIVRQETRRDRVRKGRSKARRSSRKRRIFTAKEEEWLWDGVRKYGVGNWKTILESYPFSERTSVNLKDKYRVIQKNKKG